MTAAHGRALLRSRLALLLAPNLLLLALFLWASLDTTAIRLEVQDNQLTATINGYRLSVQDDRYPSGSAALFLKDHRSYRNYEPPLSPSSSLGQALTKLWTWDLASIPPSGWRTVQIEGRATTGHPFQFAGTGFLEEAGWRQALFGASRPLDPGFAPFGDPTWQDYTVDAQLVRGREDAAILVRSPFPGSGYLFWFRPEHGDMAWQVLEDGYLEGTLEVGHFRIPLRTGLKAVLRELLWSYFHGLVLVGLVLAGAVALGAAAQWTVSQAPPWRRARYRHGTSRVFLNIFTGLRLPFYSARWWPRQGRGLLAPALLVSLLALVVTAAIATSIYDRTPHVQDSVTYLFQAQTFARGHTTAPAPVLPEFFRQEFIVVKDGQWFGKYPPGHPLVLAMGVLAGLPWLVGPMEGGLALLALFLAGRRMYGSGVGLLAAVLGSLSPFFLFLSASFMSHPSELLFLTLFLLGFVRAHQGGHPLWALATGLFWGMALMTRSLSAAAFGLPFALYGLVKLAQGPRHGLRLYGGMALGALAPVFLLLWYNHALTGSPFAQAYTLYWDFDRLGFGERIGAVLGGHDAAGGLMNTWRNVTVLLTHLYGWLPYVSLAFVFIPFALRKATRWDVLLLGAALTTGAAYVFYWADGIMFGPRYYYGALPTLLLLTARGVHVAATVGTTVAPRARRLAQGATVTILVATLVLGNLLVYLPGQLVTYTDFNFMSSAPLARVEVAGLTNALVFVQDDPDWQWWRYGALFTGNSPWLDGEVIYARDLGADENRRLMAAYPDRTAYAFDGAVVREVR